MGKLVDLATRRAARQDERNSARLPLTVQSSPDGVCLVLPGFEWWLTAEQADELGDDLKRCAAHARATRGPRPRGA